MIIILVAVLNALSGKSASENVAINRVPIKRYATIERAEKRRQKGATQINLYVYLRLSFPSARTSDLIEFSLARARAHTREPRSDTRR